MSCYLCLSKSFEKVQGVVRDNPSINILKCKECGLVFLESFSHLDESFYEQGGMESSTDRLNIIPTKDDEDTLKRFEMHREICTGKKVLDFGCAQGSFLFKLKKESIASELLALEPNKMYEKLLQENFIYYSSMDEIPNNSIDVITMFHVLEHIEDPLSVINILYSKLAPNGKLVIEVPSSNDILLQTYKNEAFSKFTYWSCHLYLFNQETLENLLAKSRFSNYKVEQYQRYSIANHLYWLAKGLPGGHQKWSFMDDDNLNKEYAKKLTELKQCDSLIAVLDKNKTS